MRKLIAGIVFAGAVSLAAWVTTLFGGPQTEPVRLLSATGCTFIVETALDDTQRAFHAADCEKCQREREK